MTPKLGTTAFVGVNYGTRNVGKSMPTHAEP